MSRQRKSRSRKKSQVKLEDIGIRQVSTPQTAADGCFLKFWIHAPRITTQLPRPPQRPRLGTLKKTKTTKFDLNPIIRNSYRVLRRSGDLQGVEIQPLAGKRTHTFIESHEGRFCFPARATICNRFKNTGGSRDTVTHTLGTSTQSPAT